MAGSGLALVSEEEFRLAAHNTPERAEQLSELPPVQRNTHVSTLISQIILQARPGAMVVFRLVLLTLLAAGQTSRLYRTSRGRHTRPRPHYLSYQAHNTTLQYLHPQISVCNQKYVSN